jgi:hypothetical protein
VELFFCYFPFFYKGYDSSPLAFFLFSNINPPYCTVQVLLSIFYTFYTEHVFIQIFYTVLVMAKSFLPANVGGILHHKREVLVITRHWQLQAAEALFDKLSTMNDESSFVKGTVARAGG